MSISLKNIAKKFLLNLNILEKVKSAESQLVKFSKMPQINNIYRTGRMPMPRNLTFEITTKCNLKCPMCFLDPVKYKLEGELNFEKIKDIISSLPASIKHVNLNGGEILLHEDLHSICREFNKRNIRISITTTGFDADKLYNICKSGLVLDVGISLDGPRHIHDSLRNSPGLFDKAIMSVKRLKNLNKVNLYINAMLTHDTLPELYGLVMILGELKINSLSLCLQRKYDTNIIMESVNSICAVEDFSHLKISESCEYDYDLNEVRTALQKLEDAARQRRIAITYLPRSLKSYFELWHRREIRNKFHVFCGHFEDLRIDSQGNVIVCHPMHKQFGNLLKEPFDRIWNGEKYKEFRKDMLRNNLLPVCETCYRCKIVKEKL